MNRPALIATILGLLVILQFYGLDKTPPGFFTDESAIGYSAWSMATTGADEYGTSWPMFLINRVAFFSILMALKYICRLHSQLYSCSCDGL